MRNHCFHSLWAAALLFAAGCSTLPSVQPFTDATSSLRSAVASSGAAVTSELGRVEIPGVRTNAAALEAAWAERNQLFTSLAEYANSLQAIVDAGGRGGESIDRLSDSVQHLAAAVGFAQPGAEEATAAVTEAARFIYGKIAVARAARDLEEALAELQPAITRIARQIAADMEDLDALIQIAAHARQNALRQDHQREIAFRDQLLAERSRIMAELQSALEQGINPTNLDAAPELQAADELLAIAREATAPMEAQLRTIADRTRLSRRLISEIQSALVDWATAHARMLAVVQTRRLPSVAELRESAARTKELARKFEEL